MRNKKIVLSMIAILTILSFALIFKAGSQYYSNRYVASNEYYLKVPETVDMEIEDLYDIDGKAVDKGKSYHFKAMGIDGSIKEVSFEILTEDSTKLLKPGTYLKIEASETINLSEERISKEEVPVEIVEKLEALN